MDKVLAVFPAYVWYCIIIILLGFLLNRILLWWLNRQLGKMNLDSAEVTGIKFLRNTVRFLTTTIVLVAVIFTVPQWRSVAITVFAGAGLLVAIIGFAAQAALGNIISGIFIVIFKPFRVGDIINAGTPHRGKVVDITLRHTVIRDFQNRRIIMPNSLISSSTVVNDTINDPQICAWVEVDVAYDADVDRATKIMEEECRAHRHCIDGRDEEEKEEGLPIVQTRVIELGAHYVRLRASAWTESAGASWELRTELYRILLKRFNAEGIEIPFPYRTVVFKKDLNESQKESPIAAD